jgi:hypothetical protein
VVDDSDPPRGVLLLTSTDSPASIPPPAMGLLLSLLRLRPPLGKRRIDSCSRPITDCRRGLASSLLLLLLLLLLPPPPPPPSMPLLLLALVLLRRTLSSSLACDTPPSSDNDFGIDGAMSE